MGFQYHSSTGVHLSVVAPAHNEVENLPRLLAEIAAALAQCEYRWEVLITDDASTDGTDAVLRELRKKLDRKSVV
jgi:glycosyltransferase involved in cell wall biosynthesis